MSHEVLGDLFFQDRAAPAWHHIMREGIDPSRTYTAAEVYALFGKVDVRTVALQTVGKMANGEHFKIPYRAILRGPIKDDPEPRCFGTVGPDYVVVTPSEVVDLFDQYVKRPVQTMMFLRDGKLMVIASKLPEFELRGEHVEMYCQIGNWMDGANASTAILSGVCTVCMNTWKMANDAAVESYRFTHDQHIKHRMGEWFRQVMDRAEHNIPMMRQVMESMVDFAIPANSEGVEIVRSVLTAAYPAPKKPKEDPLAPKEYNDKRLQKYEYEAKVVEERRVTAIELFKGAGTGMKLPTRWRTLWGVYQSVVEVEDYRKGALGEGLASSVLFGDRAATKDRAFKAAVELVS